MFFNMLVRKVCKEWIKLAKKDLRKIKRKTRMSLGDAYEIGKIERELDMWELNMLELTQDEVIDKK